MRIRIRNTEYRYRTTESKHRIAKNRAWLGLTPACLQGRLAGPQCGPAIGRDTRDYHPPDSASGPPHIHHSLPDPQPVTQHVD